MNFTPNTITIYSVGLLGGSLGLALRQSGYKGRIIGLSSEASIKTALELGCIDEGYGYEHLREAVQQSEVLFLCSPINTIIETIKLLGTFELPEGLVITDVGSTKADIVKTSKLLPHHVHFIGGHPMTGSEKSGPSASDPFLFQNAIYVLSPANENASELENSFAAFLQKYLGCRSLFLNPSIHDHIAATVSHVPHLLAVALVLLARQTEEKTAGTLRLAAGGFRDMTRIASSSYPMWHDILMTNKKEIENQLDCYIDILKDIKIKLQENSLRCAFSRSQETRAMVSSTGKGFINPLSEILVHAKDQPGFIALLTNVLADEKINIKDIEVVKVREGEGGTIRLAFESPEIAKKAVLILIGKGFIARERT